MAVQGGRPNNRQIVPYLFVSDGDAALDFYQRAFGARVLYRSALPGGAGVFAQVAMGESTFQVCSAPPEMRMPHGPSTPETLGGTSVVLEMYVDDMDAAYRRAVDAGGLPVMPPHDAFFGDRYGWVRDPFGHLWALATVKETLPHEEIVRRMNEMMAQMPGGCKE